VVEKRFPAAFQIVQSKEVRSHHQGRFTSVNKILVLCSELNSLSLLLLFSESTGLSLVLLADVVEFLHVLKEVGASLESNE